MLQKVQWTQKIAAAGVVAVIRANSVSEAVKISDAVIAGGMRAIELTFTVPQADQAIKEVKTKFAQPDLIIGAGTVFEPTSARLAIMAGAQFIVSPSFNSAVAKLCNFYQIPYIPGCGTVNEMQKALTYGADIIKLFPGSVYGPAMVKSVLAPLPQVNLMPTGGVNLDNMADWFAAGVIAVGSGSQLTRPATIGDYQQVTANAQAYMSKLADLRQQQ